MHSRVLVISADDFGYSRERNEGIIKCFNDGMVSRASLLVNATEAEHAVELAKQCNLPLGLHLNLSEGMPVNHPAVIPSLCDKHGHFHERNSLYNNNASGTINYKEVEKEIKAQIEKFQLLTGKLPQFCDGHQHVHILPGINAAFAEVLEEHNISNTRLPIEKSLEKYDWLDTLSLKTMKFFVNSGINSAGVFEQHSLRYSDGFVGLATMGKHMTVERLKSTITQTFESLNGEGVVTVEMMVHPGFPAAPESGGCGKGPDDFAQSPDRQHEIDILTSPEFKSFLNDSSISVAH